MCVKIINSRKILLFLVMNKKNKGFTLTETLLTITILVILFALAVPGVFTIKKNLRQMELDNKAEIIYTAVQNRLSELYTSGLSDYYNPGVASNIYALKGIPADYEPTYDEDDGVEREIDFYYFKSSDLDKLDNLLGNNTIDDSLKNGHFVVEYLPYAVRTDENKTLTVPFVYAVYYSEDVIDVSNDYGNNSTYLNIYRAKQNRLRADARVGYYGGSTPGSGSVTKSVTINNVKIYSEEEINRAVVKGRIGAGVDETKVTFSFEFSDQHGKKMTYYYSPSINEFYEIKNGNNIKVNLNTIKVSKIGNNYTFNFVLDDLSKDGTRFKNLYKDLNVGDDITLTAICTSEEGTVFKDEGSDVGNSIYAYVKDKNSNYNIYISNGRHLQNLDQSSEVIDDYNKAILLNDIDFSNSGKFYSTYKNSYFNNLMSIYKINDMGKVSSLLVPKFRSITNNKLITLDGKNTTNKISTIKELSTDIGLFNNVANTNLTISNISLTGERVYGNDIAGGLIGSINASGNITIDNCGIYLVSNVDIPTTIKPEYYLESIRWIFGKTSGGLVAVNNGTLNISSSFVASNIGSSNKDTITGGLVGNNLGTLKINKSYADCYLYGDFVGGLVGYNKDAYLSLTNSYSAGFIATEDKASRAAGLVSYSSNVVDNCYTVIYKGLLDRSRNAGGIEGFYGTKVTDLNDKTPYNATVEFSGSTFNKVYYKHVGLNGGNNHGEQRDSFNEGDLDTSVFSLMGVSHPYKMMGASLTSYNYPKLINIDHYGDWAAGFVAGSLVYYEKYTDGSYGFDGANVAISLTADKQIAGDGYGVVFKSDEIDQYLNTSESFSVDINGLEKTFNFKSSNRYSSGIYTIYPLSSSDVNPNNAINGFYEKCVVKYGANELSFYFNPHFGRSVVESDELPSKVQGDIVYVRSPRQLNNLSLYFNDYRNFLGNNITYKQERDMNYNPSVYDWNTFGKDGKVVNTQGPIGADVNNSFNATYDGGCFEINNVNFITDDGTYVGLFGYNEGTIKNVVVATQYLNNATSYHVQRAKAVEDNQEAYFGVLAGYNNGVIDNCAIAGYYLSGSDGKIHGYRNSKIYIGGLVGYNSIDGKILNSAADLPKLSLAMNSSTCYAGAFVGYNDGSINNAYGISLIESNAPTGDTKIAGFAGYNTGSINNSYCATALVSSGNGSSTYNFTPKEGGGHVYNSYYLNGSSFQYIDDLYDYSGNTHLSSANPKTYSELSKLKGNSVATDSKYHDLTNEVDYPYRAIVKNGNNELVHYGEWQVKPELGVVGVFYWEHEEHGQNNGYKITYIGSSNGKITYSSNLCNEHDDGGVITEYGYGYYYGQDDKYKVTAQFDNLASSEDYVNSTVKEALENQIPNIKFIPFTTGADNGEDYIFLDTNDGSPNGKIILKQGDNTYNFTISPFFANAISFDTGKTSDNQAYVNKTPGSNESPYEIRSAEQLQYINWNYVNKDSVTLSSDTNRKQFTYLMYAKDTGVSVQANTANDSVNNAKAFNFIQTHDLNADDISDFVPIAGQVNTNYSGYKANLSTWFGGSFDGQSYKIQELKINSNCFTVGLFGTTCGAELKNIILYSTKGATIERNTSSNDRSGAYALGGLAGVAYDYNERSGRSIHNCSIAGYKIIDNSNNKQDLGEANVGGLVGISNISIDQCSSVVDIEINCEHKDINDNFTKAVWGNYVRVGGISGAVFDKVSNSYSGGSISVGEGTLNENYNGQTNYLKNTVGGVANKNDSTNIYLSGIAGSGFSINFSNITGQDTIAQGSPDIENCYTYINFPTMEGTIRSITMFASIADRYNNQEGTYSKIKNCYYLDSSANFDMNLPKFAVSDGNNQKTSVYDVMNDYNSTFETYKDYDLKTSMLMGETYWLYLMHLQNNSSFNLDSIPSNATIERIASKTFEELSSTKMNTLLNGDKFADVTINDESGVVVDGKYSFSAGNRALEGKNYPFPTVIRQDEYNRTVKVHYGEWPFISAHFKNGSDTIDIFNDMNDQNIATKTFILIADNKELNNIKFSVEKPEYAEIIKNEFVDGNYVITVKALKTGATDIIASWTDNGIDYEANFNLNITAKLKLVIEPNTIYLNSEDKAYNYNLGKKENSPYIQVLSADDSKDYTNRVTWKFVSSKVGLDTEETNAFELKDTASKLSILSAGYNGSVAVTATYNYLGNNYNISSNIDISTNYIVGLKGDNDTFNESILKEGNFSAASNKNYGTTTCPVNENEYFIYERNEKNDNGIKDLIGNITNDNLSLSPIEDSNVTQETLNKIKIKLGEISSNSVTNNDYNSRAITFIYKSASIDDVKCNLIVKVEKDDSYVDLMVPVTIKPQPYTLTLDANEGTLDGLNSKVFELNSSEEIDLNQYRPERIGYTFDGWYDENNVIVNSPYTPIEDLNNDVIFKAKWSPIARTFNLNNDIDTENSLIGVSYDLEKIELPSEITTYIDQGYIFEGLYYGDEQYFDADGNVVDKDKINKYILDNTIIELKAIWKTVELTLTATSTNDKTISKDLPFKVGATASNIDSNKFPNLINKVDDRYTFIGYGYDDGTLILNSNGDFVDENGESTSYTFKTDNVNLVALFKVNAYKKADNFENGQDYLIVSNNYAMACTPDGYQTYKDAISISKYVDITSVNYILNDNNSLIWNYNNNSLMASNNNKYLKVDYSPRNRYFDFSDSVDYSWVYNNGKLTTKYRYFLISYNAYITLNSNNKFVWTDNQTNNIEIYKYIEGNIVNKYLPKIIEGGTE